MTIGQRIKQRREALNLTQEELARKVGYASRSSINKIELSRDLPLRKVEKMAVALETSPSFLMGWTENDDPDFPFSDEAVATATENLNKAVGSTYYINEETAETAQNVFDDENMRMLFDTARDCKPEDIKRATDFLKMLKATNPEG